MKTAIAESLTRVFFVVDSEEDNEELYETLEDARDAKARLDPENHPLIRVCIVKNAFVDDGVWNYDDYLDTFDTIKYIEDTYE